MAKVSKDIDLDTTVVKIKLLMKGNRQMQTIWYLFQMLNGWRYLIYLIEMMVRIMI